MRSTARRRAALSALLPMLLLASACARPGGPFPPLADVKAVTETKPVPPDTIADDPVAEANYNAAVEGWGDRLHSAGERLCRFFVRIDMPKLDFCEKAAAPSP